MSARASVDTGSEGRVRFFGERLIESIRQHHGAGLLADRWMQMLFERLPADDDFRVRALRFIDVLPVLEDDAQLVAHLQAYFPAGELPLPGVARWGLEHAGNTVSRKLVAAAVRRVMQLLAGRFMAGATAAEVAPVAGKLHEQGFTTTLDLLGEAILGETEADAYQQAYLDMIASLAPAMTGSARLNLSLKASALYSQARVTAPHAAAGIIAERLRPILRAARDNGVFVYLDMEQYDSRERTLTVFRQLLNEPEFRDWPHAGIALQAYLRDAESVLAEMIDWARERGTPVSIRLVRGAYWDFETITAARHDWPSPVWHRKFDTDRCYERCLALLIGNHPVVHTAVATHNLRSIALAMALAEEQGLLPADIEFQMLQGMATDTRAAVRDAGYPLRVYLPFGELLPGMAYLVRRLLENSSSQSFARLSGGEGVPGIDSLNPHAEGAAADQSSADLVPALPDAEFRNTPTRRFVLATERDSFARTLVDTRRQLGEHFPLWIDGEAVDTAECIESYNPASPDELIGTVAAADDKLAEHAITRARAALDDWRSLSFRARAGYLLHIATLLAARRDEFAALEILEAGKTWQEADANVVEAIDFLRYYAQEARQFEQPWQAHVAGECNRMRYLPRGVGVIIPPWNFPLAILTGMLSAAIVTGNTVILKPSSETPVIAARFVALTRQAGLPAGVVNFLPGAGATLGDCLARHPGVNFIAFTGSLAVGCGLYRIAAETPAGQRHIKHIVAEMGGKNAIIVDHDADVDEAVAGVLNSAFGYQGQKCSACSRVITVGNYADRFVQRLCDATASVRIGLPENPDTFAGPVISASAQQRIRDSIAAGDREGQRLLSCAVPADLPGYFVGPTIFTGVSPRAALGQEEIFGPVLTVLAAPDMSAALRIANDSRYALTAGIYSRSPAHIKQAVDQLAAGNIYINRQVTGALVGRQPFGGFRLSGMGNKAGGPNYLLQFVQEQTITENTLRKGFAPKAGPAEV